MDAVLKAVWNLFMAISESEITNTIAPVVTIIKLNLVVLLHRHIAATHIIEITIAYAITGIAMSPNFGNKKMSRPTA